VGKKILSIIETAHRATLEEQDDTVIWLMHATAAAGAPLTVVLRGNAVGYAVKGQDASGLVFGDRRQTMPPRLERDVATLVARGVAVLVVEYDLAARGLEPADLVEGVEFVSRAAVAKLVESHDLVWHW
jgi:intracellular sulfur oxidation DsrE/DsrF family protein